MSEAATPHVPPQLGPSALKAYAHPLRLEIIRYLQDHEAATATELAKHLGENTGQTSYHLRQLAKHGLIEDDPTRGKGRERWWRTRSYSFNPTKLDDPALAPAAELVMNRMVQDRAEALARWISREPPPVWMENSTVHRTSSVRLTPEESERLINDVLAVLDRYVDMARERRDAGERPEGSELVRIYFDLFPLLEGEGEEGLEEEGEDRLKEGEDGQEPAGDG